MWWKPASNLENKGKQKKTCTSTYPPRGRVQLHVGWRNSESNWVNCCVDLKKNFAYNKCIIIDSQVWFSFVTCLSLGVLFLFEWLLVREIKQGRQPGLMVGFSTVRYMWWFRFKYLFLYMAGKDKIMVMMFFFWKCRPGWMKNLLLNFWKARQILLNACWIRLKKWQVQIIIVLKRSYFDVCELLLNFVLCKILAADWLVEVS